MACLPAGELQAIFATKRLNVSPTAIGRRDRLDVVQSGLRSAINRAAQRKGDASVGTLPSKHQVEKLERVCKSAVAADVSLRRTS